MSQRRLGAADEVVDGGKEKDNLCATVASHEYDARRSAPDIEEATITSLVTALDGLSDTPAVRMAFHVDPSVTTPWQSVESDIRKTMWIHQRRISGWWQGSDRREHNLNMMVFRLKH
jgi:hypothetical protein